jgi:prophage regulatory protein
MGRIRSVESLGSSPSSQQSRFNADTSGPARSSAPSASVLPKKLLRMKELVAVTGLSRAWINRLVREGVFPRPLKLGAPGRSGVVAWLVPEIDDWIEARRQERDRGVRK